MAFKGSGNATMWCRWQSNGTVDRSHAISSVLVLLVECINLTLKLNRLPVNML